MDGSLTRIAEAIGAKERWDHGYDGSGVDVALIDTGVSPNAALTGRVINGPDLSFESQVDNLRYLDSYGHGTHMAGIIAGYERDASSEDDGRRDGRHSGDRTERFSGVAPGARIVSLKIGAYDGAADVSQVIAAIDWVVQHRRSDGLNIRVLNLSFGTDGVQSYVLDPLAYAVEVAWHKGIVVVVAGGNEGFGNRRLNNPATDPYVIAVGASDMQRTVGPKDDTVSSFSSRGDAKRTVDLVAPGKSVISLRSAGSWLDESKPNARVGERYFRGSGTSQAAAVVSGAAALLLEQRPNLTPDEVKCLFTRSASRIAERDVAARGAGLLNVKEAARMSSTLGCTQTHVRATGLGSLDAARGSTELTEDGVSLEGEIDIFGTPFDTAAWSTRSWTGTAWDGGDWMGHSWTGAVWCSDSWTGHSWTTRSWTGHSWTTRSWTGHSWTTRSWTGQSWAGADWSGDGWASDTWTGAVWSSADWGDQ